VSAPTERDRTGGVYRIDGATELAWITSFLD
jgi:hypothetical protein